MERRRRGRPKTGRTGRVGRVYLPDAYWRFLDLWDGNNDSQKLVNALDDLERFRPHGPGAKLREPNGRFLKHTPILHALASGAQATQE